MSGSYSDLYSYQRGVWHQYNQTILAHTNGGAGTLTLVKKIDGLKSLVGVPLTPDLPSYTRTELTWEPYDRPIEKFEDFSGIPQAEVLELKARAAGGPNSVPGIVMTPLKEQLLDRFISGKFTFVSAKPVVTKTTQNYTGGLASSRVYYQDVPTDDAGAPIEVEGFTFLKIEDTRQSQGRSFLRIERWKGDDDLDVLVYPPPPPPPP